MIGYLVVSLFVGGVVIAANRSIRAINAAFELLADQTLPVLDTLHDLRSFATHTVSATNELAHLLSDELRMDADADAETRLGHLIEHEIRELTHEARRGYEDALRRHQMLVEHYFPAELDMLERIQRAGQELIDTGERLIDQQRAGMSGGSLQLLEDLENREQAFLGLVKEALDREHAEFFVKRQELTQLLARAQRLFLVLGLACVLLLIGGGVAVASSIVRPVVRLVRSVDSIRAGNWNAPVPVGAPGELGELAGRFTEMAHALQASFAELEQRTAELSRVNEQLHGANQSALVAQRHAEDAQRAAEGASQAKSVFLANMSHEIRTPLNAIIGMTSLLGDSERSLTPQQRDFIATIRESSDTLLAIVNDVLDVSKIEADRLELDAHPFDLRACLEAALDLVAPQAAQKGLELVYEVLASVPRTVVGDAGRLRQIVMNLLGNAVKFTLTGEVVLTVSSRPLEPTSADEPPRHEIHVAIRDTGIGIPADRQSSIFESFTQVDASTTRKFGGTGLGLTICKHLVKMMGGDISVDSEPGSGSTFQVTICLPVAGDAQPVHDRPVQLAGKRALIVDDHPDARRSLEAELVAWGMDVAAVADGSEALEALARAPLPAVVLVDAGMPGMSGPELGEAIRAAHPDTSLPLILLTTLGDTCSDPRTEHFAVRITKPIKPGKLKDMLMRVVAGDSATSRHSQRLDQRLSAYDETMATRLPLRILVAEDNRINQRVVVHMLARLGYQADVAAHGRDALAALERQRYDVVLMDILMPEMDGMTALQHIRARHPADRQPRVVAVTANATSEDRQRYLAMGMDDYVSKPIHIEELVACLERCSATPYEREEDDATDA